jgi:hypothetical protein
MNTSTRVALFRTGAAILLAVATVQPAAAAHSAILPVEPLLQEATIWCGAATAQMVMKGYPIPPGACAWISDPLHDQSDVAASIFNHEDGWDAEPRGLRDTLATLCPLPSGHSWVVFSRTDPEALMYQVAFYIFQNEFPVAALLDTTDHGTGSATHREHWVAVTGIRTDVDPTAIPKPPTVDLLNVFYNDPASATGGTTKVVSGSIWYGMFQAVAKPTSAFDGKYVAVIEPPTGTGTARAPREVLSGRLISAQDALAAAQRGIREIDLTRVGPYEILGRAKNQTPLLVDGRLGGYYLIPYTSRADGQAEAALFVNAYTGGFQEADVFAPTRFLSEEEARQAALRYLKSERPKSVEAELVSSAEAGAASRSRPLWKVRVDGRTVGVTQTGTVVPGVSNEEFSISIPARRPQGLAAGGGRLWTADAETGEILELAPKSGNVVRRIPTGLRQIQGLAFDGASLRVADLATREILGFDPASGQRLGSLPVEAPREKGYRSIEALAADGGQLWTAIAAGFSSSFNQIDDAGKILRSLFADCDPRGLAVEGGHLWSLCYNGEKNPPTLDRRDLQPEEVGFQRSRSLLRRLEGRNPRGLAYDGVSLWYLDAVAKRAYRYTPGTEVKP